MDILRPPILRIGNRCYRKNPIQRRDVNTAEEEEFTDFIPDSSGWNDESCSLDCMNVEKTEDGYKTTVTAPSQLFKFVIGRKGETRNRLEVETRTKLKIPRQGQEGDIVIQGHDRGGVESARTRIEVLLDSGRQKQPFTHFLSIPVTAQHIQDKMKEFREDVLRDCDGKAPTGVEVLLDSGRQKQPFTHFLSIPVTAQHIQDKMKEFREDVLRDCDGDRGVDGTIFQEPCKTHVTIGCLALLDDVEIRRAVNVLQECNKDIVSPILKGDKLHVNFTGLEYMNDDPSEVDVLYMKVDDTTDRLQTLADRLVDKFTGKGLMLREYDRVKLHATIMNTVFRKDPTDTSEPYRKQDRGRKDRESFNASRLLKKFRNYSFGSFEVTTVHLSQRHSFSKDGYYTCAGSLELT